MIHARPAPAAAPPHATVRGNPALLGMADHAVQAAAALAIMGVFLAAARPEDFGRYALVQSLVLLPLGLHAAAVVAPMQILLPRQPPPAREALGGGFRRLSRLLGVAAALAVATLALAMTGGDAALAAAAAAFAFALIARERSQAEWCAHLLARWSLRQTIFHAAAAPVALGLLVGAGAFHARSALLAVAGASLAAVVLVGRTGLAGPRAPLRATWLRARPLASWALVGAVLMWAQGNLYAFATYLTADAEALGRVAMARAALVPVTLVVAALGFALRPQLAALVVAGDGCGLLAARRRAFATALAAVAGYGLAAGVLIAGLGDRLLPAAYDGTDDLARLWLIDGLLLAGAGAVTPFLIAALQLRTLALANALSAAVGLVTAAFLASAHGAAGALAAQLAADAALCAALLLASGHAFRAATRPAPLADRA